MAKGTDKRLVQSAIELFSSQWYEEVSVAEICRNIGLSNGVFYRYFQNKEEIFRVILDDFLLNFSGRLSLVQGRNIEERLGSFIDLVIDAGHELRNQVLVFREGQYRFPAYERKLRTLYLDTIRKVYEREISEEEYLYIVSGIRFASTLAVIGNFRSDRKILSSLILNGVFHSGLPEGFALKKSDFREPDGAGETQSSRQKILDAGIRLIGRKGYYPVNIHEITREAGFGVGTFYLYFPSKEQFMEEAVGVIGHGVRSFIRRNLGSCATRLEQEVQGIWLFLKHFEHHREYYQIVREAEFISREAVNEYYRKFESGYIRNLEGIDPEVRQTVATFLMGLSHYLGIEVFFSGNIRDIEHSVLRLAEYLSRGIGS